MLHRRLKIAFLDCTKTLYNEETAASRPLGGIERCIISLSRALSDQGHEVQVFSNETGSQEVNAIRWSCKYDPTDFRADIVIACNDATLFDLYAAKSGHKNFRPFLWHHNPVRVWREIRKGRALSLARWRPTCVFLGDDHRDDYPVLLRFCPSVIIGHGIEPSVLEAPPVALPVPPHAAFISQSYRGLDNLIRLWTEYVFPRNPQAQLHVYSDCAQDHATLKQVGIHIRGRVSRTALIDALSHTRVMLIPGHKDETFCLSALEGLCLGIPMVTFGTGSLKERVRDGQDGFLVRNNQEFAEKTLRLLQEDDLWQRMSHTALESRAHATWAEKAVLWDKLFQDGCKKIF